MKRILLAGLLASLAFAASAQDAVVPVQANVADTNANDNAAEFSSHCLHETGSLIVTSQNARAAKAATSDKDIAPRQRCAAMGRSYSREDLERTGAIDLADALRQLDPAIH